MPIKLNLPVHLNKLPLTDPEKQELKEWLMSPATKLFIEQLSAMEAESAIRASAFRLMPQDLAAPKEDAVEQEQNAHIARLMKQLFSDMQTGKHEFFTLEIKTHPYTTTQPLEGENHE